MMNCADRSTALARSACHKRGQRQFDPVLYATRTNRWAYAWLYNEDIDMNITKTQAEALNNLIPYLLERGFTVDAEQQAEMLARLEGHEDAKARELYLENARKLCVYKVDLLHLDEKGLPIDEKVRATPPVATFSDLQAAYDYASEITDWWRVVAAVYDGNGTRRCSMDVKGEYAVRYVASPKRDAKRNLESLRGVCVQGTVFTAHTGYSDLRSTALVVAQTKAACEALKAKTGRPVMQFVVNLETDKIIWRTTV